MTDRELDELLAKENRRRTLGHALNTLGLIVIIESLCVHGVPGLALAIAGLAFVVTALVFTW